MEVREVDGELVVVDQHEGRTYALNPVASFIWDGLDTGLGVTEIIDELASEFGAPIELVTADVTKVVNEFVDLGVMSLDGAERGIRVDLDDCLDGSEQETLGLDPLSEAPEFDTRYLAAPPNY